MHGDGQLVSNSPRVINSTKTPLPTSMLITPKPHPDGKLTGHRAKLKPKGREKPPWFSATPERKIELYHKDAERRCLTDYADDLHDLGYYCPCLPTEFRAYNSHNFPFLFNSSSAGNGFLRRLSATGAKWPQAYLKF